MKLFGKTEGIVYVAEIGVNHEGILSRAFRLMELAKEAKADAVKFQAGIVTGGPERQGAKYAFGEEQLWKVAEYGRIIKIPVFASALSVDVVPLCAEQFPVFKVASRSVLDRDLAKAILAYEKPVIVSVPPSVSVETAGEIWDADLATIFLHCVPDYPTEPENARMERMAEFQGYSNHVIGPEACYAAAALGAELIECHFTDDKRREFRDHQLSFEPHEFAAMVEMCDKIRKCL